MDRDALNALLNLKPAATAQRPAVGSTNATTTPNKPPQLFDDQALKLDAWDAAKGEELCNSHAMNLTPAAWSDLHATAYKPEPELTEACADQRRQAFVKTLLESPDCQSLRQSTCLNQLASEMASLDFARSYAQLQQQDEQREAKAKAAAAKGKKPNPATEEAKAEAALMRAAGKALKEATKDVEELEDARSALGMGTGGTGDRLNAASVAELFNRVKNNPALRRICELAGRYRRLAQSKQRKKTTHGFDDLVSVVTDGDVGRLLPEELAKLTDEDLELDTLRRIVERRALCRQYKATEPVGKGPIIVCVDESGSMHGEPINQAKAFCLAMAWMARHQKRWCSLVAYSGDSGHRILTLPPGRWNEGALLNWLEQFIGRGSCIDVPVRELPDFYQQMMAPVGITDVVFVTDAICSIPDDVVQRFNAWKAQSKAKLLSLIIGGYHDDPGSLKEVSDETYLLRDLNVEQDGVERCFSI